MATHLMESDGFKMHSFISNLIAGIFSQTLDFTGSLDIEIAFGKSLMAYLSYEWPIMTACNAKPIEPLIELALASVIVGQVSGSTLS